VTPSPLPRVLLRRDDPVDPTAPTYGRLSTGTFECDTMERPRIGDHPCIPPGEYVATCFDHPEHGRCYELKVDGRTGILLHPANWWWQLLGCVALGRAIMPVMVTPDAAARHGRKAGVMEQGLSGSDDAYKSFMADRDARPFILVVS
jgi:hypothetical protein